jgi:hypothetical protein
MGRRVIADVQFGTKCQSKPSARIVCFYNKFSEEGQIGHELVPASALEEESISLVLIFPRGASFESVGLVWPGCASNLV